MNDRPHIAYISYTGLTEPLGASQILPYLGKLSRKYRFTVISYEKASGPVGRDRASVESELARLGNVWIDHSYHRKAGLLAKLWDVRSGVRSVRSLASRDPPRLIHARGYLPAAIAAQAVRDTSIPFLFDIRGLQGEESVDAGTWRRGGLLYRLTKLAEGRLLARASAIVTLTDAVRPYLLQSPGLKGRTIPWQTIPTCVDTDHFTFDESARFRIRRELGIPPDAIVFVYSGSAGTWYSPEFAARLAARHPQGFLLFLTFASAAMVRSACEREGLPSKRTAVLAVSRDLVPHYLSAADVAVCPVLPLPSKIASSPTKVAEALSCGLPVVALRGVGDLEDLAERYPESIRLTGPHESPVISVIHEGRERHRRVAEREFSLDIGVERYDRIYSCLIR